ncbi:hypothetical protein CDO52_14430 [Nocardiopsis gilva YIM 90087]|uniref:Uncharacterized protein n=1 Tax=Nocardiopsis gilva YIM 90087 TaxID=1235441 RepID=A0A223S6R4_9ACTN|nr:DUF6153 family protein [Nocardiopsis gilva]ASU83820.1 hypothetical protein CDO52_14430 [Nocardiopsis gilva YIM 90087]
MPQTGSQTRRTGLALGILALLVACVFAAHHEFLLPEHTVHTAASAVSTPSAAATETAPGLDTPNSGTETVSARSCDSSDSGGCLTAPAALPLPAPALARYILLPPPAPTPGGVSAPPAGTAERAPPDLAELSILRI